MNLEHHRKQAKRLLRGYHQDEPDAVARVHKVLGQPDSMSLADAQQVIAVEHGQRSWADFKRAIEGHRSALAAGRAVAARAEQIVDTDLEYRPGDPVRVRVAHREQRITVTDGAAAIARAGRPAGWRSATRRLSNEIDVNISRDGAISLPVVRVGPGEQKIVERIARASLALYQELLDLDTADDGVR